MYRIGQEVYIVCNGWIIKKARILKYGGGLYTLEFEENASLTRLKAHRLHINAYSARSSIIKRR